MPVKSIRPGELLTQIRQFRQRTPYTEDDVPMDETMKPEKQKRTKIGDVYFFEFDKPGLEKPWQENKDKMEDYFNYGFNEESFKIYQQKIRKYASENLVKLRQDKEFEENCLNDLELKWHPTLNFYMPHELGGCGAPYFEKEKYELFNIFHEDKDLAIVKPRWTMKQEFKVDLPPNTKLDEQREDEDEIARPDSSGNIDQL